MEGIIMGIMGTGVIIRVMIMEAKRKVKVVR